MNDLRKLTPEELAQLQRWAAVEGRYWKDALQKESWWRGIPARDRRGESKGYELLYGLRNTHGPSWLVGFKLPK